MKHSYLTVMTIIMTLALLPGCSNNASDPGTQEPPVAPPVISPDIGQKIKIYQEALSKNPEDLNTLIGLGNLLMDDKRFAEAVDAYQKALKIAPDNANVRVDMGTCYLNIKQPEKAVEEFKKALEYHPNHINALTNMGVALAYDIKDFDGALEAWEKVLELAPDHQIVPRIRQEIERIKSIKAEGQAQQ
jgi:tetratricopeptide (TPR) repeat protein